MNPWRVNRKSSRILTAGLFTARSFLLLYGPGLKPLSTAS